MSHKTDLHKDYQSRIAELKNTICTVTDAVTFLQLGRPAIESNMRDLENACTQLQEILMDYIKFKHMRYESREAKGDGVVTMDHPAMSMADMSKLL
jgi:hypothetical protein